VSSTELAKAIFVAAGGEEAVSSTELAKAILVAADVRRRTFFVATDVGRVGNPSGPPTHVGYVFSVSVLMPRKQD